MRYALYKADGTAEFVEVEGFIGYEKLRELVGGSIEFYVTQIGEQVYLNEEGRLTGLRPNPFFFEDLRGDVVVTGGTDGEGESLGVPDDYELRSMAVLPLDMFRKGEKFTIMWINDSWGATAVLEITTTGEQRDFRPVFKARGKRTPSLWRSQNAELAIFRGWDLPIQGADLKELGGKTMIRMNALYNITGLTVDEAREYVAKNQINPFFVATDHWNYVDQEGKEELLFPNAPATSQRIADMQSAQLGDGTFRMVMGG